MRLLHYSLRSLLLYALLLVLVSIPVSFFSIRHFLNNEVDESLAVYRDQFMLHIKNFEYLADLETDLQVLDQLAYDIAIKPSGGISIPITFSTVYLYDSTQRELRPFRELASTVLVKKKSYLFTVRMSLVESEQLASTLMVVHGVLLMFLISGLVLVNNARTKKLWQPFYKILDQLKRYELDRGGLFNSVPSNISEFEDLNKAVDFLISKNRKVFLQQKEFIENASHELQTPIAVFQSKIDVLMQAPSLTEAQATIIMELERAAQRMARLNKNLLLLSKIENEHYAEIETIELDVMIPEITQNLVSMVVLENVHLKIELSPTKIVSNKILIEVMLLNLFYNAVRYNVPSGYINIRLTDGVLKIENPGTPLKMDGDRIFERFSRESKNTTGTGLGLAIVKKICDSYGYKLSYSYEDQRHGFSISFFNGGKYF